MENLKLVIERHSDGFVSYPLGLKGVVVGQGDTYEEALSDVESAINFHVEHLARMHLKPTLRFSRPSSPKLNSPREIPVDAT